MFQYILKVFTVEYYGKSKLLSFLGGKDNKFCHDPFIVPHPAVHRGPSITPGNALEQWSAGEGMQGLTHDRSLL